MLSSVPVMCGLEARLLLCGLLLCTAASDERLLCGVSGDGEGGSSVVSAGMPGAAPLRRRATKKRTRSRSTLRLREEERSV
jgi:hypothetical protein